MIVLHRLTHPDHPFYLNDDAILTVEAHPDTVIALANGTKCVVIETPDEVADRIRSWRAGIAREAAQNELVAVPAR